MSALDRYAESPVAQAYINMNDVENALDNLRTLTMEALSTEEMRVATAALAFSCLLSAIVKHRTQNAERSTQSVSIGALMS